MALVGMGAFFGASVRAPVTGMVLVIEMTATTSVAVPMMAATAAAVLAAYLVGSPPIYDSLRERMPPEDTPVPDTAPGGSEVPGQDSAPDGGSAADEHDGGKGP